MRLLSRINGTLSLRKSETATYAILSHTWGPEEEEVILDDIVSKSWERKTGYKKVDFCLAQAQKDGYTNVWIDTCCIDKTDRNELGEAINCMYDWYARSAICYVYLQDVSTTDIAWRTTFKNSRWFTRGWTLQELIAPKVVHFYSVERQYLGDKVTLHDEILTATNIDTLLPLEHIPIPTRYSWSLSRQTTKVEDLTYCMLGLMGIKLLFNYGEGAVAARERLFAEVEAEHGRIISRPIRHAVLSQDHLADVLRGEMTSKDLMDSLKFGHMGARRDVISNPLPQTCTWLLNHPSYQQWSRGDAKRFLWIKGKPGAGKSTLMKYADYQTTDYLTISFYFNARGEELERSAIGLYRAVLHQLLQHDHSLQDVAVKHITQTRVTTDWTIPTLQSILQHVVTAMRRPIRCFIDALDECAEHEAQDMIHFLEDISYDNLFICLASRYYPTITVRNSLELLLEEQRTGDLERYVTSRLDLGNSGETLSNPGETLKARVIEKANGVFLWAVLVVKLLNKKFGDGDHDDLQEVLDSLPGTLLGLLEDIALRHTDDDAQFRLCIGWILFARVPMSGITYHDAMLVGLRKESSKHFTRSLDNVTLKRYVASTSRGLAELTQEDPPTVQFIHESVRDFLLKHEGLAKLYPEVEDAKSHVHANMTLSCKSVSPWSRYWFKSSETVKDLKLHLGDLDIRGLPKSFMHHAATNIFYYAEQAVLELAQDDLLLDFDCVSWRELAQLNWHMDWHWIKPLGKDAVLAHVLSVYDTPRLIYAARRLGKPCSSLEDPTPLQIAVALSHYSAAFALLDCSIEDEISCKRSSTTLSMLIASKHANLGFLREFLAAGAHVNDRIGDTGRTALSSAIEQSKTDIVSTLLEYGAATEVVNQNGWTPLIMAILYSRMQIVRLLLRAGANVEARSPDGHTLLMTLARKPGSEKAIHLLLEHNAKTESRDSSDNTALHFACRCGNLPATRLLLSHGADIRATNKFGTTTLMFACYFRYTDVEFFELLLSHGVMVEQRDMDGVTALMVACRRSHWVAAALLVQKGASLYCEDNHGENAIDTIRATSDGLAKAFEGLLHSSHVHRTTCLDLIHAYHYQSSLVSMDTTSY